MADQQSQDTHSPTVQRVLTQFIDALQADDDIAEVVVDKLEPLLQAGSVPKADDINNTLFPDTEEDES